MGINNRIGDERLTIGFLSEANDEGPRPDGKTEFVVLVGHLRQSGPKSR